MLIESMREIMIMSESVEEGVIGTETGTVIVGEMKGITGGRDVAAGGGAAPGVEAGARTERNGVGMMGRRGGGDMGGIGIEIGTGTAVVALEGCKMM